MKSAGVAGACVRFDGAKGEPLAMNLSSIDNVEVLARTKWDVYTLDTSVQAKGDCRGDGCK